MFASNIPKNEEPTLPEKPNAVASAPKLPSLSTGKKKVEKPHVPSFKSLRKEIFRDIHIDVMKGGKFADVELALYTRRTKTGSPYQPYVLAVNKRLLSAASSGFERYVFGNEVNISSDGYTGDSDLEEDGEVVVESGGADDVPERTPRQFSHSSAKGAASYDFDSLSDDDEGHTLPPRSSGKRNHLQEKTLQDGAFRTWQAMVLYLYDFDDQVKFKPLRSSPTDKRLPSLDAWACSPKSMYRLANKFKLHDLESSAKESIKGSLTADNIVQELFSDFTWRYPNILQMEVEIFSQHSRNAAVDQAFKVVFDKVAAGEFPHSSVVLKYLFTTLISKSNSASPTPSAPASRLVTASTPKPVKDAPTVTEAASVPSWGSKPTTSLALGWGNAVTSSGSIFGAPAKPFGG